MAEIIRYYPRNNMIVSQCVELGQFLQLEEIWDPTDSDIQSFHSQFDNLPAQTLLEMMYRNK